MDVLKSFNKVSPAAVRFEWSNTDVLGYTRRVALKSPVSFAHPGRRRLAAVANASSLKLEDATSAMQEQLEMLAMGELRALAKSLGLRGDTKAELIDLIISASPSANSVQARPPATSAPASYSPPSPPSLDLHRMPLPELREAARQRGLRGATREELLLALALHAGETAVPQQPAGRPSAPTPPPILPPSLPSSVAAKAASPLRPSSTPLQPSRPPPPSAKPPLSGPLPTAAGRPLVNAAAAGGRAAPVGSAGALDEEQLLGLGIGELRRMAREVGARGDTKAELVAELLKSESSLSRATAVLPTQPAIYNVLPPFQSEKETQPPAKASTPANVAPPAPVKSEYEAMAEEQSNVLRLFLGGGLALAAIPLLTPIAPFKPVAQAPVPLPEQSMVILERETGILLDSILKTQATALEELQALVPLVSPDVEPNQRVVKAKEFCKQLQPSQRSQEARQFCYKISQMRVENSK